MNTIRNAAIGFSVALVVTLALLGQMSMALAGTTGALSGSITDQSTKAAIAGATVNVASPSGRATTKTDARGYFSLFDLSPDTYTVTISAPGYQDGLIEGVTTRVDRA